jgi:PhoH-like ATPase
MAKASPKKIFVLDTSVLLFDHQSIQNFKDHDVAIPITVLEELDRFKIGNDTKNFQAREIIRYLDKLSGNHNMDQWISLGPKRGRLKIVMSNVVNGRNAEEIYGHGKNDHRIINAALTLAESEKGKAVILVTKDINLRLKAKAIGLPSEDYETGKVKDVDESFQKPFRSLMTLIQNKLPNSINEVALKRKKLLVHAK